jgi:hypothetical protein
VQQLAFEGLAVRPELIYKSIAYNDLSETSSLVHKLHSSLCPQAKGHRSGCHLSTTLGAEVIEKPKRTLLPLLTVLFVISYGLLTMLVVEQARTIDSQRGLIRDLFQDSVQLSGIKERAVLKKNAEAMAKSNSHAKAPPAAPGMRQPEIQNRSTSKLRRPLPLRPPKDTSGEGDQRRMLISI